MRYVCALTLALALPAALGLAPALAAECGGGGEGQVSVFYDTGETRLDAADKARLARFAETAKSKTLVCIFAQVDAQGSEAANKRVAKGRAETVRRYLISQGVPADRIRIARESQSFTLFGLLGEDQKNERKVTVSFE